MLASSARKFYYHLGLHYSQTESVTVPTLYWFYYHLGLHYSQTCGYADVAAN